ncbi:hypothetical protein JTB14_016349 [Gonioctena quinquepunctata]|nr:hypothetical protein JTB14_016349 [Gonioctena quinquepunctata]
MSELSLTCPIKINIPTLSFKLQDPNIQGLHLPYLVCLLQTAGYQLERVECVNPKHIPQKGVSVVLTCGYSGQRCVMRYPEEKDVCNCFVKGEDSGDYYLEAVSNGNIEEPSEDEKMGGHTTDTKNLEAIKLARENGITMTLPAHTTHRLQPCDVLFFKPLTSYYNQAADDGIVCTLAKILCSFRCQEYLEKHMPKLPQCRK